MEMTLAHDLRLGAWLVEAEVVHVTITLLEHFVCLDLALACALYDHFVVSMGAAIHYEPVDELIKETPAVRSCGDACP